MKEEKRKHWKSIILISLSLILITMVGCSSTKEVRQTARDKDQEFDGGSEIYLSNISEEKIKDLAKLCKVWGLVKYYHPQVVAGDINWDYELFRIIPSILEEDSDINSLLYEWVDSLDSEIHIEDIEEEYNFIKDDIQLSPSIDWCKDENYLGEKLSFELSKVLDFNRLDRKNGYVRFQSGSPYAYMENENSYAGMMFDDSGYRLLSLFRYWNIIEYYYPYKDIIEEDWDQVLLEFIPKIIEGSDYESYILTIAELTTKVYDSHAYLVGKDGSQISNYFGMYTIPVNFTKIDNQIVISKIIKKCGLEVGDIVVKVGDKDIDDILENRRKYISQSREDTGGLMFQDLFRVHEKKTYATVIRDGKTMDLDVKAGTKYIEDKVETKSQEMEGGEIYYINAGLLKDGEIDEIMDKWWDTKGLILDLRNYPSSHIAYELAEYLIPVQKEFFRFSFPNPIKPGEFHYFDPFVSGKSKESNSQVYKGNLVIIIDEHTISQGETTTMSLRNTENSIVLGRPSAGANGDLCFFTLPGNIRSTISGLGAYYPDKGATQRIGMQPDIYMEPTIEGLKEGRDELIEKAIEIIREGF